MKPTTFTLPDVGEGLAEAEVVQWLVETGATVRADQPVVVVETAKAQVELPAPADGVITVLSCAPGDTVPVGSPLFSYETGNPTRGGNGRRVLAAPGTRRLAVEHGIDLTTIAGTGPHGRIVPADLTAAINGTAASTAAAPVEPDDADVQPLRGLRRQVARAMTAAWAVPHITEFREIDATELESAYLTLKADAQEHGTRLTLLPLLVRAVTVALRRHPGFNATFDVDREEVTRHRRMDIGIAAATAEGLLVPVLRGADRRGVAGLAREIARLGEGARQRSLPLADLTGATFTISNFGSYGTWLGTPLINAPQVAIAGFGRVRDAVVPVDGRPEVHRVLPLAVAADHRLIDGEHLGAFVNTLERLIRTPLLLIGEEN